jgi:protein-tyrosine kinase
MSRITEALRKSQGGIVSVLPEQDSRESVGADVNSLVAEEPIASASFVPVNRADGAALAPALVASPSAKVRSEPAVVHELTKAIANDSLSERLVVSRRSKYEAVAQYRRLATTLHLAQREHGIKVVLITSALDGEGKSLTAVNTALTLSESFRRRVLLIDADLRRPSVHQVLGLSNGTGLSDCLAAPQQPPAILQISKSLSVLLAGPPDADPVSGLTSDRMQQLLQRASAEFDWVIVDTPPATVVPDADLLARFADGVVLVVAAGVTPHNAIVRAIEALGQDRIIGVVLNRANVHEMPDYSDSTYYGDK